MDLDLRKGAFLPAGTHQQTSWLARHTSASPELRLPRRCRFRVRRILPEAPPSATDSNERRQVAGAAPVNGASGRLREMSTRRDKMHLIGRSRLRPQIRPSRLAGVGKFHTPLTTPIPVGAATGPPPTLTLLRSVAALQWKPVITDDSPIETKKARAIPRSGRSLSVRTSGSNVQ